MTFDDFLKYDADILSIATAGFPEFEGLNVFQVRGEILSNSLYVQWIIEVLRIKEEKVAKMIYASALNEAHLPSAIQYLGLSKTLMAVYEGIKDTLNTFDIMNLSDNERELFLSLMERGFVSKPVRDNPSSIS